MSKVVVFIGLLICFQASANVDMSREDHQKHFAASAAGTVVLSAAYKQAGAEHPTGLGLLTMLAIGALKELVVDNSPDGSDMEANALGGLSGAAASVVVLEF